jgi:hypothetical protein
MMTNDICSYVDTSLLGQMTTWTLTNNNIANNVYVTNMPKAETDKEVTE